jgi:putative NADH-flavin reductase
MKLAIIGASGFVGSVVVREALDRDHEVTAIARNPEKITVKGDKLRTVEADVYDEARIVEVLKGHDAVISAYNPGWSNPNIFEETLAGGKAVQKAVKKSGVKRLLVVGGGGSLYIAPGKQLVDTPEFPEAYKAGALALRDYLNVIKEEKELDWTFLSPAIEMHQGTSGERRGQYRKGLENPVFNEEGRSIISAEDMAMAILDEIENPQHIRQRFTVGY